MALTTVQNQMTAIGNSGASYEFVNRIINGAMVIDQRNAGASVTPTGGQYLVDRWVFLPSQASKLSFQQNAGSVTPPTGFINYLGATSTSSYAVTSGDYFLLSQIIEGLNVADFGWGASGASPATLSFWVRSSITGTFGGSISNNGYTYCYPFTYTISSANTWEYKTVSISAPTSGTWLKTNGIGIQVNFSLGTGTTNSGTAGTWASTAYYSATGAQSVVGTNGATLYITGVQLEKGTTASAFDFRDYGRELMMCQRYYQKSYPVSSPPGQSGIYGATVSMVASGTNYIWANHLYRIPMRTTPTLTFYSANGGTSGYVRTTNNGVNIPVSSIDHYTESGFGGFGATGATSGLVYDWLYTASAEL